MSSHYPVLFSPEKIGALELKNRVVMAAMGMNQSDAGFVNDAVINHYEARAKGGVGLIMVEVTCVDTPLGRNTANMLVIDDDKYIPGMQKLADAIHKHGAKCFLQISHTGRGARRKYIGEQPVGPSAVGLPYSFMIGYGNETPRALTNGEIKAIEDKYAEAALRAKKAGFDGIEFHCTGYYLGQQFLSSKANLRTDEYGGSKKNRIRFHMNVIQKIKKLTGDDFPIAVKLSIWEMGKDGGITLGEGAYFTKRFQDAGVYAIEVLGGVWSDTPTLKDVPDSGMAKGMAFPLCTLLKLTYSLKYFHPLRVKLIGGGRAGHPDIAEKALEKKTVDFVFIGKQLLAQPDWVNLVQEGKEDLIRPCIGCGKCIDAQLQSGACAMCSGNAVLGHGKNDYDIPCAPVKKKVVVVGGGVGGVEAARIAAMRGHEVILYEKSGQIGGQLHEADIPPHKENMVPLIPYLEKQLAYHGVTVFLNREATVEDILAQKPDAIIISTGVLPVIPPIPGIDGANVVTAQEALTGKAIGENVVIIGGGVVGCEIAELLGSTGKKVTIVEIFPDLAAKMVNVARTILLGHLDLLGVQSLTGTKCLSITDSSVNVLLSDGQEETLDADTVIVSVGYKPNTSLFEQLKGKVPELYNVGDSKTPDSIAAAVSDGYYTAIQL